MTDESPHLPQFAKLLAFLRRVPAVQTNDTRWGGFGTGEEDGIWWVKFGLDLDHPLAWHAVQEFGHVLNLLSVEERLPTLFKPVSPPPYLNGGPRDYLSWIISCRVEDMSPDIVAEWLEGRLPNPVDDPAQWADDDE